MVYYIKNATTLVGIFCRSYDRVTIIFSSWVLNMSSTSRSRNLSMPGHEQVFSLRLKHNHDMLNLIDMDIKGTLTN